MPDEGKWKGKKKTTGNVCKKIRKKDKN